MNKKEPRGGRVTVFWFRRDLRLDDNTALNRALKSGYPVLPVFIFDTEIIEELPVDDARITFIYQQLEKINARLNSTGSVLEVYKGEPIQVWQKILQKHHVASVFANKDYEPYALERDGKIGQLLGGSGIPFTLCKDQVIFEESEILKSDGKPYTVFTPYKKKWLENFNLDLHARQMQFDPGMDLSEGMLQSKLINFPSLEELGFKTSRIEVPSYDLSGLKDYARLRDFPAPDSTSHLSPHLRFGTVSIRKIIAGLGKGDEVFLSELIWREFFMQILFHFPDVVHKNFNSKYDGIAWRNDPGDLEKWQTGMTGYPLVDAGMRQLNSTGFMHNRVRMVTASFLCKHLLVDWRQGEAYFAGKLLDYELSSNNGNWQWSAGTGCDAAPYFRIFNPIEQLKRFDPDLEYVKRWVPELGTPDYPDPMIDHPFARARALDTYKAGIEAVLK
jgi:deoxyribodipyrimidine photo-lyase